jgi:hypothetical protein
MRLSSIFSFETYREAFSGRAPGLALALGLLLVVEFFFGSSRVRDGIAPRSLEKSLGLPTGAVVNMGITQGTPFDALTLYRRNRERLKSAKIALFGLDFFQFDQSTRVNERVNRFATFSERLDMYDGEDTLPLLVGSVWRTYDSRVPVRRYLKALFDEKMTKPLPMTKDGRLIWHHRKVRKDDMARRARQWLGTWKASAKRLSILETLIAELKADGVEVALFQLPTRDGFWRESRERYGAKCDRYYAMVRGVAETHDVALYDWEGGKALGLKSEDFYDWGHMSNKGARTFSKVLAKTLKEKHPRAVN